MSWAPPGWRGVWTTRYANVNKSGAMGVIRCAMWLAMIACMCVPAIASAQTATEKAIRARQSSYFLMAQQMVRINATLKGELAFDKAALEESADAVELMGRLAVDYYLPGSDQGSTKAKPEIWKEMPRFKQMAQASQTEATKLKSAVHGGNLEVIKAAYGAMSKSCKACHDAYRMQ